jgi:hypothetical protein
VLSVWVWALLVYRGMDSLSKEEYIRSEVSWETRSLTHTPGTEGVIGWHTTSSITVGHRSCHRWARWWARRGTGTLSADCCYSNLLNLFRVKTSVWSYNLYATPFLNYPSHLTLVKLIKLKRTQTVCTEKERKRERKRKKTERKQSLFAFFS